MDKIIQNAQTTLKSEYKWKERFKENITSEEEQNKINRKLWK